MRITIPVAPQPHLVAVERETAVRDPIGIGHQRKARHQHRIGVRACDGRAQDIHAPPTEFADGAAVHRIENEAGVRVLKQH